EIAARVLGWPLEELAAMRPLSTLAPDERPRIELLHQQWKRGESGPRKIETVDLARDVRRVPVEATAFTAMHGGKPAAVAFYADIEERVRAQEAVRASEHRFRQLAEAAPDAITLILGERFVYANPAAVRMLGFDSEDEFVARPLRELVDDAELAT